MKQITMFGFQNRPHKPALHEINTKTYTKTGHQNTMLHKINTKTYAKINTKTYVKIETKLNKIYIIKYEINGGVKMVEKFNDYLIIQYPKNKLTNIYKRKINKIYHNRYEVETYYRVNKIDKCFKSKYIFNEEQIENLINVYLEEYNIEKTIYYK